MRAAWQRLAGLAAVPALALAGAALARERAFTESTDVTAVEIPVQVLLDGKPVRGLTAADFAVFQGKERQPITGFDSVDLYAPGAGAPEREAARPVPAAARRHFLLLFDLAFSEPKAIVQARDAARGLLDGLHPSDLVAVATYAASRGPELVLGFTPDRAQIAAAIDTLGVPELIDRNGDPLKIMVESVRQEVAPSLASAQGVGGATADVRAGAKQILLDRLEGYLRDSERANLEIQKDKVTALARSFTDLAKLMRSVEGRKHVVYLSEGYDSSLLLGTDDDQTKMRADADRGEVWKVNSDKRFGSSDAVNEVEAMLEELRRADCVVQAVDIGGLRAAGGEGYVRKGGRESLFQLAHDTGGELYESSNDLSAAMDEMLERTGVTYVLTIQPDAAPDGTWHPLRVELRNGPRGARVVHRPGYYAPRPFAQRTRLEKMMATAGQVLTGEAGGTVHTSVLVAPLPAAATGTADVPVLIEVDGPSLLHLHEGPDLPAEIYVYVLDGQGRVRDFLAQTLALDLTKVELSLLQAGLKFYGHLELPPGSYRARVLVRNGRTGLYSLAVVPVEVPALAGTGPVLLPPFFPEPRSQWLVAREAPRPGRRDVPPPFRIGDRTFLPAAKPVLAGRQEARFAMLGYNLAGELRVRSQVLTADGREVDAGELALVGRQDDAGAERLELTFRPAALKPGEYLLRVTVIDAAGRAGTASAPFVVAAARS